MSTTKTELDRSIYSYYHQWDSVTPFRFKKERPHSAWLRYFPVTITGHEFPCSAKQRLFLHRDPQLKSFALIDRLYFSHFSKFLWKYTCSALGCFSYMFIVKKGKLLYRLSLFFSSSPNRQCGRKTNSTILLKGHGLSRIIAFILRLLHFLMRHGT